MFEAVGAIIAAVLKVGVPIFFAAFVATAIALFLPDSAAKILGIVDFRQTYAAYLGGTLIASASLLAAYGISALSSIFYSRLDEQRMRRNYLRILRELTTEEKLFLRPYISENENTSYRAISDGIAGGLTAKRLIYRAANISHGFNFPYNLQPVVRRLLNENPDLLN